MKRFWTLVGVITVLLLSLSIGEASRRGTPGLAPRIKVKDSTSTNWSGYAVFKNGVQFTDVRGGWTQPAVVCPGGNQYAAFWVGIDGYDSKTVEQIGTDSDCSSGTPVYYAWYEMYPQFPASVPVAIHPGDVVSADVQSTASGFVLSLTNVTTQVSWSSKPQKLKRADLSSAEWIAEAPSSSGGVLPLANFGKVNFTGSYATGNGTTGSIADAHWSNDPLTMVTTSNVVKATPSALQKAGTAFGVTWSHQ